MTKKANTTSPKAEVTAKRTRKPKAEAPVTVTEPTESVDGNTGETADGMDVQPNPWQVAAEELLAANATFAADLTPDQVTFIVDKCQTFTCYADVLAVYNGSGSVNSFARQLCLKVNPELGRREQAPKPTDPTLPADIMVFCDLCGRHVPANTTVRAGTRITCADQSACKKAKSDPKTQTQNVITRQAVTQAAKDAKTGTRPVKVGRQWPWPDAAHIVCVNANHGRTGVRADIFGTICADQTVGELKVKTFSQRGGVHKIPVPDVLAAVAKGNIRVFLTDAERDAYKAEVVATATALAKQGHLGEAPTASAEGSGNDRPEDACIAEAADIQADAIANA